MNKSSTAIVILAFKDYEALEISLAAHAAFIPEGIPIYILQNGRGGYDQERTLQVGLRYEKLYVNKFSVVTKFSPDAPYNTIKKLLNSEEFSQYDYICKIDDDAFPITSDWFEKLERCYVKSKEKYGDNLGYVTPLVNINTWGARELVEIMSLNEEFQEKIAREHIVGYFEEDKYEPRIVVPKGEIYPGLDGTIFQLSYMARWLHHNTTLKPDEYIKATKDLPYKEVYNKRRYSINCIYFQKNFWNEIDIGITDDERMVLEYCADNDKKIICEQSVPFVHINYFPHREENQDILEQIRNCYESRLNHPFPISMCPNREIEIENRLRFMSKQFANQSNSELTKKLLKRLLNKIF